MDLMISNGSGHVPIYSAYAVDGFAEASAGSNISGSSSLPRGLLIRGAARYTCIAFRLVM